MPAKIAQKYVKKFERFLFKDKIEIRLNEIYVY